MIKLICAIITLQYLLTGLFGENSNSSGESTCSYNVIIPTTDVVKKCDAYAEAHLEKLRKRYFNLRLMLCDVYGLIEIYYVNNAANVFKFFNF